MNRGHGPIQTFLNSRKVCVTGQLASMTHAELAEVVESAGGTFLPSPRRTGFVLVVGNCGGGMRDCPTRIFRRARRLRVCGYHVDILSEDEFLRQLGFSKPATALRGEFTIGDLARLLKVSPACLRRWRRLGLLVPRKLVHGLAFFDLGQVSLIKRLCELRRQGTSLAAVRRGLAQIRRRVQDEDLPLSQLARLEHDGRLLFRAGDQLLDGSGQHYFDFSAEDRPGFAAAPRMERADVDSLFDAALALEDAGKLDQAATAYRRALAAAPQDPALHFNLGNVLSALQRHEEAVASFEAALRCDESYAQAWNNLGNVQARLGRMNDAVNSFRRAIQLVPSYTTARENLSEVVRRLEQESPLRIIRAELDLVVR